MDDGPSASAGIVPRPEIDGYRVGEPIGQGTYSVVYEGEQVSTNRPVALKVLVDAGDPMSRTRFDRELEIMARLADHRYVVTIVDSGEVNGQPWIAMERLSASLAVDGGCPRQVGAERVADIGVQAACALATMHRAGMVHRDVKPSNLLEGPDGLIKLGDFGIAKQVVVRSELDTFGLVGTEAYMAPEVLRGSPADARSDQYGLCATLVSLLLGRPCGTELKDSDVESLRELGVGGTPEDLLEVLARGLRRDPEQRYGSLDELAQAFDTARRLHGWRGEPYVAPMPLPEPTVRRVDPRSRPLESPGTLPPVERSPITRWMPSQGRRRRTWVAIGSAGALVAGGVAWWTVSEQSTGTEAPQPPATVTTPRTSAVEPPARPIRLTARVRGDSALGVAWDYPNDVADGFFVYVNGAEQPEELSGDTRFTTLSGFTGERQLCVEVAAVVAAVASERSQPSCVNVLFEPSLPPEGVQPDNPAAAEEQIRQAMSLVYGQSPRRAELLDDNTGIDAAATRLVTDPAYGPAARSATPDVGDIVFTSPIEAWFMYDLVTTSATFPNRFGSARLQADAGWQISRATFCQDLGVTPDHACVPDVVPVRPPQPPTGLLEEIGSSPTIVNVIGGIVHLQPPKADDPGYNPVVTFDYVDRECDVEVYLNGFDPTPMEIATDGYCQDGKGTLQVFHLCEYARSTQRIWLRDAAGHVGPVRAYEYECSYDA